MTEQFVNQYEEDEISLLDILVTLAESWKLLVLGPMIAGVLAGTLSFLWPKTFESVAIVRLTEEEAALLHAAPVLDPLIVQFDLLRESDGFMDDARQELKKRLTFSVDKKTKLTYVSAKARTPEQAQMLGASAIAFALKELQVKGKEKALIEKTIAINDRANASAEDAIASIQRGVKKNGLSNQAQESAIDYLAAINSDIVKRSQENVELLQKLELRGAEVFVQDPSLPQRKISPKRGSVVLLAMLASGFLLLVFVFIRKVWQSASKNAEAASKIATIKRLLGFKEV